MAMGAAALAYWFFFLREDEEKKSKRREPSPEPTKSPLRGTGYRVPKLKKLREKRAA
jgi:hypothetical protein